jgi:hypothetical protein
MATMSDAGFESEVTNHQGRTTASSDYNSGSISQYISRTRTIPEVPTTTEPLSSKKNVVFADDGT